MVDQIILRNTDLVKISDIISKEYPGQYIKALNCVRGIFAYFGKSLINDKEDEISPKEVEKKLVGRLLCESPIPIEEKVYDVRSGGWVKALSDIFKSQRNYVDSINISFRDEKNKINVNVKYVDVTMFASLYEDNQNKQYFGMTEDDWNGVHLMKSTDGKLPQFTCMETRCNLWGSLCKYYDVPGHKSCMKNLRMSDEYFTKVKHSNYLCSNCYRSDKIKR
jgi:hypothetical protein